MLFAKDHEKNHSHYSFVTTFRNNSSSTYLSSIFQVVQSLKSSSKNYSELGSCPSLNSGRRPLLTRTIGGGGGGGGSNSRNRYDLSSMFPMQFHTSLLSKCISDLKQKGMRETIFLLLLLFMAFHENLLKVYLVSAWWKSSNLLWPKANNSSCFWS